MIGGEQAGATPAEGHTNTATPALGEALRLLREQGRAGVEAARDTLQALRALALADFALARGALLRGLVCLGAAALFAGTVWLLLMASVVAAMQMAGWSWLNALLLAALLNAVAAAVAAFIATRYFAHTGMRASRRQAAQVYATLLADWKPGATEARPSPPSPDMRGEMRPDNPEASS